MGGERGMSKKKRGMLLARILQLYANLKCINSPINDSAKKTHNNYTVFPSFISRGWALV